jgi:hypothetical protein
VTIPRTTSADANWFVMGYRRALARFHDTQDAREEPEERFIPLFEALNWAAAIVDPNSSLRASLITDGTVQGLRFVRNRVHHQWADALEARDEPNPVGLVARAGVQGSRIVGPPTVLVWFWKPLNQLPPPDRPDPKGEAAYRAHLAGEPARHALDHLDGLLPALARTL